MRDFASRLEDLFAAALERPVDERETFLETVCGDNETLHSELAGLLKYHVEDADPADPVLRPSGNGDIAWADHSDVEATTRYRNLKEHKRGGQGKVFVALDDEFGREIALKELHSHHADDPALRDRFLMEARITSGLQHPGIVPVYAQGKRPDGRPFYAMRFIDGETLQEAVDKFYANGSLNRTVEFRQLLARFVDVCNTIEYAHCRGIVHRDLKPRNILLREFGETLVVDWGLAKPLANADLPDNAPADTARVANDLTLGNACEETFSGSIKGTPRFMSPEQAFGNPHEIGTASDVYSLGATLYFILTGRPPVEAESNLEAVQRVRDGNFPAPSVIASNVPRALEAVCLRAMQHNVDDRYTTVGELRDDVEAWLAGEPVGVYRESIPERTRRWLKRHRTTATGVSVLLVTSFIATAVLYASVKIEHVETERQRRAAVLAGDRERDQRVRAERKELEAREARDRAEAWLARVAYLRAENAGRLGHYEGARLALGMIPANQASWETVHLHTRYSPAPRVAMRLSEGSWGFLAATISPDESQLVTTDAGGLVVLWDAVTGRLIRRLTEGRFSPKHRLWLHHLMDGKECFADVCWLGKGQRIALATLDGRALSIDTRNGESRVLFQSKTAQNCVSASRDGNLIAFGCASGNIYLYSLNNEKIVAESRSTSAVTSLCWSQAGECWIAGHADGELQRLDGLTLNVRSSAKVVGPVWSIDVAERRRRVAVGCEQAGVVLLHLDDLKSAQHLALPSSPVAAKAVHTVRFSVDESRLWVCDDTGHLSEWGALSREIHWRQRGIEDDPRFNDLAKEYRKLANTELPTPFRRFGTEILPLKNGRFFCAGRAPAVKLWQPPGKSLLQRVTLKQKPGPQPEMAFDRKDAHLLWILDRNGKLHAADSQTGRILDRVDAHEGGDAGISVVGSTGIVATVGGDPHIRFWSFAKGRIVPVEKQQIRHDCSLMSVTASHDGKFLATVDEQGGLRVWDANAGNSVFGEQLTGTRRGKPLTGKVEFSTDGRYLAAFGPGQSATLFAVAAKNTAFRKVLKAPQIAGNGGTALAWNPARAGMLMAADDLRRFTTLAVETVPPEVLRQTYGADSNCTVIAATPDRRRIVVLHEDGRIAFLHAGQFVHLFTLATGMRETCALAIGSRTKQLAVATIDGTVQIYSDEPVSRDSAVEAVDRTQQWAERILRRSADAKVDYGGLSVRVDPKGRVGVLLIERRSVTPYSASLRFLLDDGAATADELIEVDGGPADRTVTLAGAGFRFASDGQPRVVFRRREGNPNTYDFRLYLARRTGKNGWNYEKLPLEGNIGMFPQLTPELDGHFSLLHFSYGGHWLLRHDFDAASKAWTGHPIGHNGDGMGLAAYEDRNRRLHLTFSPNRINGDPSPQIYARWDGGRDFSAREVVSATAGIGAFALLPDASPVVLAYGALKGESYLLRRGDDGWTKYRDLPSRTISRIAIARDGTIYAADWDRRKRRLLLWRGTNEKWSAEIVAARLGPGEPGLWEVHLDRDDRPLIVAACSQRSATWIRVYRPR